MGRLNGSSESFCPKTDWPCGKNRVALCHAMLDTLLQNHIALCDAGVGIGKTYAYLTACILLKKFAPHGPAGSQPVVVSTSSVALQDAIIGEYLPFISRIFSGEPHHPEAHPRDGAKRQGTLCLRCSALHSGWKPLRRRKRTRNSWKPLLALRTYYDLDTVTGLSGFDRRQVCVPKVCEKSCPLRNTCRYHRYLREARSAEIFVQICNHNYLLADAAHRLQELRPLLNDYRALVIDEAHKLPDAARQMYGKNLSAEDFTELCGLLTQEKQIVGRPAPAGDVSRPYGSPVPGRTAGRSPANPLCVDAGPGSGPAGLPLSSSAASKTAFTHTSHGGSLTGWERQSRSLSLFFTGDRRYILYHPIRPERKPQPLRGQPGDAGTAAPGAVAAAHSRHSDLRHPHGREQLSQNRKQLMGLSACQRLDAFCSDLSLQLQGKLSAVHTQRSAEGANGQRPGGQGAGQNRSAGLVEATHGHTLALFTSYSLMGTLYKEVKDRLVFPLLVVWRHAQDVIQQFKQATNAVLFAAGSCWEGVDFPGDMVSSLIIVRLPFPVPDPLSEAERETYPTLQEYIRAVIVPDMQRKLRQGFGRAIRTETDTCVVSILDKRAASGGKYHEAVLEALPEDPFIGQYRRCKSVHPD